MQAAWAFSAPLTNAYSVLAQAAGRAHLASCLASVPAGAVCSMSIGRQRTVPQVERLLAGNRAQPPQAADAEPRSPGGANAAARTGELRDTSRNRACGRGRVETLLISRCVPGCQPIVLEVGIAGKDEEVCGYKHQLKEKVYRNSKVMQCFSRAWQAAMLYNDAGPGSIG